ncbi:GNAT family N-acetyltransferase [Subtercola boreus]|uniref:N-acetyltransferase domain-containing protein n=1 Tax=Subtercola boreus TaxID=120213 RepID=A0A3E0W9Y0_9MICO|nr:acetyltransferase [Subtercola boreus]RFA20588.1 hypothetical protein B7R24_09150 [Subtercola boreus]RFA20703.1 hypothetical protein B7R23_09085 [Subtercola boreus]RFA26913.1 hypothetical protein B7R25_09215 [Subtercola boreus]
MKASAAREKERRVVRADPAVRVELEAAGWAVIAGSWGAGLAIGGDSEGRLAALMRRVERLVTVRELRSSDVAAILDLDAVTAGDYPGDVATAHDRLNSAQATPTIVHRGWGAFRPEGQLVGMTYVDVGEKAVETDFTVVQQEMRGRGLGTAVKAASVLALVEEGYVWFRTGGSLDNPASIAANRALGYVLDEEWLTFARTGSTPGPRGPRRAA